jgi:hypothetical protein
MIGFVTVVLLHGTDLFAQIRRDIQIEKADPSISFAL